jgi:FkbM family methyltransferase
MKFNDVRDYFRLRRSVENAWPLIRQRKKAGDQELFEVRFRDGRVFRLRPATRDKHVFNRLLIRDEYRIFDTLSGDFDCVIDIGGHIGTFSFLVAPFAQRVVVFEPVSENFELLKRNLCGPDFEHVCCVNAAVSDGKKEIKINLSPERSGSHSAHWSAGNHFEMASALSLADIFIEYGVEHCDLLKIDCEGSEYEILFSADKDLISRISRIVLEYHDVPGHDDDWNAHSLRDYLETMGFSVIMKTGKRHTNQGVMLCHR